MLKFPFMCRLCLIPSQLNSFIKIFDDTSEIPVKILELTNVKVESGDGLPQEMCVLCRAQLDLSVTFKRQVEKADSMLRQHLAQLNLQDKENDSSEEAITGDPFSEVGIETLKVEGPSEEVDETLEGEERTTKGVEKTLEVQKNTMEHDIVEENKTIESDSVKWDDVVIKVEDNIVVAEPWPEPVPGENNCAQDDNYIEENKENHSEVENNQTGTSVNKIKEENEPESPPEIHQCSSKISSEDEDEVPLNQVKINLTWTDRINCSCQFCTDNKQIPILDDEKSSDDESKKCELCLKTFETQTLLKMHQSEHRKPVSRTLFKCRHCDKGFPSRKGLHAHQRQHTTRSRQEHRRPKKPVEQLKQVQQNEQPENVRRSTRPSRAPERHVVPHYSCSKCGRIYSDELALENHEKIHLGNAVLKCNHCGKKFHNKEFLEKHIQSSHLSKMKTRSRGHQCNICGQSYENRSHLFSHMRSHKSTVHLCEVCGKTVSLNAYPAHKRSHISIIGSEEIYQCDLCEKKFTSKVSLRTHKNSYHGTLKFTCEVCGKQFTTMALMRHHQHVHSGKRDHVCQVCGRAFTLKITLKSHMRIHTGEMPYKCDNCGRQFTWKTTYRNHVSSCKANKSNLDIKCQQVGLPGLNVQYTPMNVPQDLKCQQVVIPNLNVQYTPMNLPQEVPIDYSEEAKYQAPIDYSEEAKPRHFIGSPTKSFPIVLNFSEEIKYVPQQPINCTGDIKPYSRDLKSPV